MLRKLWILTLFLALACQNPGTGHGQGQGPGALGDQPDPPDTPLKIELSDGQPVEGKTSRNKTVEGRELSDDEVTALRKMFDKPLPDQKDRPAFLRRERSLPAPRTAEVKKLPFPPEGAGEPPPVVKAEELKVQSIAPEGALEHAPRVSISFNSPMIAVSDPAAFETGDPLGIKLEPRPEGKWRWLGTQTLIFEAAQGQMPRATEYSVTVPAGIKDVNGTTLKESVKQQFSLPRPQVISTSPTSSGLALEPLVRVVFNQSVDPKTTPSKVRLNQGSQDVALRSLSPIEADKIEPGSSKSLEGRPENTIFFFQAAQPLKPGNTYTVVVEEGVTSLEGPLPSDQRWNRTFSTYAPLQLTSRYPDQNQTCSPLDDFHLYFNNELDRKAFSQDWVKVEPEIKDFRCWVRGGQLILSGEKKGQTAYRVTVQGALKDRFEQTLGKPLSVVMKTGNAPVTMQHGIRTFTVLDPGGKPALPVFTTNVKRLELQAYRVQPEDWPSFQKYLGEVQSYRYDNTRPKPIPPGQALKSQMLTLSGEPDTLLETQLDLSSYLDDGEGNLVVFVQDPDEEEKMYPQRQFRTWVQGTRLGLDLEVSHDQMIALVTRLKDGEPVKGATLRLGDKRATTDDQGLTKLSLPSGSTPILKVESEEGSGFLPQQPEAYGYGGGWNRHHLSPTSSWFLFDDRGLYKPKEKVHVKGYVRTWQRGPKGQLTTAGQAGQEVSWSVHDPRGNKIREGTSKLSAAGGVELTFDLPDNTNLGSHQLQIWGSGLPHGYHSINVQEFRRPEFEVTATTLTEGPHLLEESATVEGRAAYYTGGGLAGADMNWIVSAQSSSFTPPGRGDFTFGQWTPWWDMGPWWREPHRPSTSLSHKAPADGQGKHLLKLDFLKQFPPAPTTVTITATAADVNRQQRSGTTSILVHPSARYVGLKTEKSFVAEDESFELEAIVTDIEGKTLPGIPMRVKLFKLEQDYGPNGYRQNEVLVSTQEVTSSEVSSKLKLTAKAGGSYKVRAEVLDENGRRNRTEFNLWKAGGKLPSTDRVQLEQLTLVPSQKEYKPGETARILVMAPFSDGEGMVVWSRDGIEHEERFSLKNGTATVSHPITEELIPNLHARLTVAGRSKWGEGTRPAVASGHLNLSVSTESRKLTVEVLPSRQSLEPGGEVDLEVVLKDHKGAPVEGGEVTLWVVDEAVLGLVGYTTPEPLSRFYGHRAEGLSSYHLRTAVVLGKPEERTTGDDLGGMIERDEGGELDYAMAPEAVMSEQAMDGAVARRSSKRMKESGMAMAAPAPGRMAANKAKDKAGKGGGGSAPTFAVRTNFDALAIFRGQLPTDKAGKTTLKVKLPDNLTRYRVMAVAVEGSQRYGSADQMLTARLPVMVRPSLPRFLNFGDKTSLPVVIQNQTEKELTVQIVGETTGTRWVGAAGKEVKVPAKDRVEVRFQAEADQVGEARFRFGAVAGEDSDAATITLPVYTPASGEAFATYGSIAGNQAINQPVRRPGEVWPQFGGLEISLSSTAMSELTDAFLYLYSYRFECAEQRASRMLGIAAMGEVLAEFNPQMMPDKADIKARMLADSLHLTRLQNSDGGWQYWRRENKSVPFVSIHVAHALARSKKEGYEVNQATVNRSMDYLREIVRHCQALQYGPSYTRTLEAYSLYVRDLFGEPDAARARTLFRELKKNEQLNLEAIGWLWPTLARHAKTSPELKELRRLVLNRATQTADKAQFAMSYGESDGAYLLLHSSRRTDAILLDALLVDQPQNPLNTKLVKGLLAHRVKGRWNNTQENFWVLLALQTYFRVYEKETPNFDAQLWLKGTFLGQETFRGRSAKEAQLTVPMADVPADQTPLVVGKKGPGRLYYRVGMKYAPKSLRLPAESRGFTVERTFKGMDDENDVRQAENGDWIVKAGAKVEVTLTMVVPERRYHVALVDELAAGLEPLNPALKGTPPVAETQSKGRSRYWWWRWYQHENLRDERVEAFSTLVYPGVYTYSYTALASTPGEYVLPPAKAEEMYSPEVYGRTATGRLTVEE